ncbi:MAG: BrnT family toxin [Betaproteobacteria bacterium]|nr:BrnT family toxin [Betaproteobacteria bacterium]
MRFEWDSRKAAANLRKHGVAFEEAVTALKDDFSATARDLEHSVDEFRFITFGISSRGRLLAISHTDDGSDAIRIISARLATRGERKIYEEG